ncbi:MAG: 4-(cytidine 5'-diphospho)-2-C-methyl-D-erythritol kinase [Ktedonobacterales bacterium]
MPSPQRSLEKQTFAWAYAKINLTLDVLGRREDGYHNLASIMQTIGLHDTLRFETTGDGRLDFSCDVPELNTTDNLVPRAAMLLKSEAALRTLGASIELHKETPAQAGLGGGSSDAACTLVELNHLWELHIPPSRLLQLAAELGSDVPFFLSGGTGEIGGRGEHVTQLPAAEPLWLVLAKPATPVATALVFRSLPPSEYSDGSSTALVAAAIRERRPIPFEHVYNALEPGVWRMYPEIAMRREHLLEAGAPLVRMSGSGPTLYAPFRTLAEASAVFLRARVKIPDVWLTHTL